jgi:hypothetical protein
MTNLTFEQLSALLRSVFALQATERWLTIMVDLPDERVPDRIAWRERRRIASEWFELLRGRADELPFAAVVLCVYPNVGSNNNDLPAAATLMDGLPEPGLQHDGELLPFGTILERSSVVLALTELSATAPLKLHAKQYGFRGASMPGFLGEMIPVLALDYEQVNARVMEFKTRMDRAESVVIRFEAGGREYTSHFDLRHRSGHASGGLMREPGMVANLPSGEAYIVPYEGERESDPSRTSGELPVQFDDEVVVYRLENNRAADVLSVGAWSDAERDRLRDEPAYGNMAEVGIGVLSEWGVQAVGSTLLDEKLGLHIAFGRSDHFGGITSPASFRHHDNVVHIDRVYVASTQPLIGVTEVVFVYADGTREVIIEDGEYVV